MRSAAQRHDSHQERSRGVGKGSVEDQRAHRQRRLVRTEHKKAAKRRVTDACKNLLSAPGVRPRKRIKCVSAKKLVTAVARQRKRQTPKKREADIFDDGVRV